MSDKNFSIKKVMKSTEVSFMLLHYEHIWSISEQLIESTAYVNAKFL